MFYFLGLLSIITGLFKSFIIMYLIVFIHEFGHIFMSLIFSWKIKKICIYPFGGYTIFLESINKKPIEEFLVFLGGILFQLLLLLFIMKFVNHDTYIYKIFMAYNLSIISFNMLPIVPLDGSKILNIILNYIYSFSTSHLLSIYISYIFIILLLILNYNNLNMILITILLIFLVIKEHKNHLYIFNNFLLERYLGDIKYKKVNIIRSLNIIKTKKYSKNIFMSKNRYYDEYEILNNRYKNY